MLKFNSGKMRENVMFEFGGEYSRADFPEGVRHPTSLLETPVPR